MAIRIESINVNNLVPLPEFHMNLAAVNLIYSHNELGKTHLVEFLIQSHLKKERSKRCALWKAVVAK